MLHAVFVLSVSVFRNWYMLGDVVSILKRQFANLLLKMLHPYGNEAASSKTKEQHLAQDRRMADLFETKLTVLPEWIDHNGHMNVAFYVLAFDEATDAVYETWGLGFDYPEREGCSIFTIGMNVDYRSELFEGDPIRVTTQLVDWDHKRVHYYHEMFHAENGRLAATNECLAMNVDLETRRSTAFPESVQSKLRPVWDVQNGLAKPKGFGRQLMIRRR